MRALPILVPALALGLAGFCPPSSASANAPAAASAKASPQDAWSDWRKSFLKASNLGATSEMERLVKSNQDVAIYWIIEKSKTFMVAPSESLEKEMGALRRAWRGAINTDFADNVYEYYSLLSSVDKEQRNKMVSRYDEANKRYGKNLEKKDPVVFGVLWGELEGVAGALGELGDHYYASQAWLLAYSCVSTGNRGDDADLYKACKALKNVVEQREKVDLRDRSYGESSTLYQTLKAQGYDRAPGEAGPGEPGDGGGPPKGGIPNEGPEVRANLSFEIIEKISTYARPSYFDDELHNLWTRISLAKKGSSAKISSLGDLSPQIMRTGSAKALIDTDGDGEGDLDIPLRGKIEPVHFKVGEGDDAREWGCLVTIGTTTDMYQSIQVNMNYDDNQMALYMHAGGSMVGSLGEVPIRLIDENMDGLYGGPPTSWNHDGVTPGVLHPEFDSVVIGKSKRALPWSEYQKIGDEWYRLETEKSGTVVIGHVVPMETGKIKLSFKGGKPTWLVVQGTGKYENSFFDLMDKNTELPAGKWTLYCGELRKGKKIQTMKTLILPGKAAASWDVAAGETTKAELGAPFDFDFAFEEDKKTLTIHGNSVVVTGKAGERYERPWNCVAHPEGSWRKKGDKKGSKHQKFKQVMTQDELSEAGSWAIAWFPVSLTIHKKGGSESSEVQLKEKKHKLFGKIESTWKE